MRWMWTRCQRHGTRPTQHRPCVSRRAARRVLSISALRRSIRLLLPRRARQRQRVRSCCASSEKPEKQGESGKFKPYPAILLVDREN